MPFTAEDVSTIRDVMAGKEPAPNQTPDPAAGAQGATNTPPPATPPTNTPPSTTSSSTPPPATTPPPDPAADSINLQEFGVKDFNELKEKWKKIPQYEKDLAQLNEYKAGPKFKSERHKFIYDLAARSEGMELSTVRQLIDVVELLDQKDAPDQRVRFEAFKLRPENKGLSQDEIHSLFAAEEIEKFGNPQDEANPQTEIQKIRAKQATTQAKETLSKLKNDWDSTRPAQRSPEEIAKEGQEYRQMLQQQLTGFEGISGIKLNATDSKGEKLEGALNFKIDPEKQLSVIMEAIADPQGMWESILDKHGVMEAGKTVPDFKKWAALATRIMFMDDLLNNSYQQGVSDREASQLKGARNLGDPGAGSATPPPPPPVSERSEAAREFMKVTGLK